MSDIVIPSDKFARLYENTITGYAESIDDASSLEECKVLFERADAFDDACREILYADGDWKPEVKVVMDRAWLALEAAYTATAEEWEANEWTTTQQA